MTLECINPADLPAPETYTQVVVAMGTRLIFVSGQEPEDANGKLVGLPIIDGARVTLFGDHKPATASGTRARVGLPFRVELDVSGIEKQCRLGDYEQDPTKGGQRVPIAIAPYCSGSLDTLTVGTEEVMTGPDVTIQSVAAQVEESYDKGEEIDEHQRYGRVEDQLRAPRIGSKPEPRLHEAILRRRVAVGWQGRRGVMELS